jgi:cobalt-zinc-cadmium efflux system membrane fusion protein
VNKKTLIFGLIIVAAVVAGSLLLRTRNKSPKQTEEKSEPNTVEISLAAQKNGGIQIAESTTQTLQQKVSTTGVISPDEARVSHIVPLSQGVIEDVLVQLGDRVSKGQRLIVYDNIELGAYVGEYNNRSGLLQKTEAQRDVAKKSLDRANSLIAVEAISPRELDLRRAEYQQANAEVDSRRAELARAEEKLHRFGLTDPEIRRLNTPEHGSEKSFHRTASHATLRSPLSGVITKFEVSKGEVVSRDKELLSVVDTSTVWALADVYEKDIRYVARGGRCYVALSAYPGEVFKGTIAHLSDSLDPASRTAKLRCVLPNADGRLKLEMFATVSLPTKESRTGVIVPATALQEIYGQSVVFIQTEPSKFQKRVIELGERTKDAIEIRSGLKAGEKVVTSGSFYVKAAFLREQIGEGE